MSCAGPDVSPLGPPRARPPAVSQQRRETARGENTCGKSRSPSAARPAPSGDRESGSGHFLPNLSNCLSLSSHEFNDRHFFVFYLFCVVQLKCLSRLHSL